MYDFFGKFFLGIVAPVVALLVLLNTVLGGIVLTSERPASVPVVAASTHAVADVRAANEVVRDRPQVLVAVGAIPNVSESPPCEPGGLSETAITQRVAERLVQRLREAPIDVTLFGGPARDARPLTGLRGARADAVLILHTAGCDPGRSGFHTYSWHGHEASSASHQLANRLTEFYGSELRGRIAPSSAQNIWERRDHTLLHPETGVHRSTPAVVVELGSLLHDSGALHSSAAVESMAIGLASGVRQFLSDRRLLPYEWQHARGLSQDLRVMPVEQSMPQISVEPAAITPAMAIQPASIPAPTVAPSVLPGDAMLREVEKGRSFQLIHGVTGQPLAAPASVGPGCQALYLTQTSLEESLWVLQPVGEHYRIMHLHSSRYLDAAPAGDIEGMTVMLCEHRVAESQRWQFHANDRQVRIVSMHGGRHLDLVGGRIVSNQPSADTSQGWILRPVYPMR
jgi:hypothetical protein